MKIVMSGMNFELVQGSNPIQGEDALYAIAAMCHSYMKSVAETNKITDTKALQAIMSNVTKIITKG